MKLSPQVIADAEGWVEKNGLFPQPCGASIKLFCKFLGISFPTYQRWEKNISFLNAITRAREVFRQTSVQEVSNALIKAAKGVEFTKEKSEYRAQKITEYDPQTGKKIKEYLGDKPVQVKGYRETMYYPPDVNAAKFVLKNLDPENWKDKQDTDVALNIENEEPPVIVFSQPEPPKEDQQ